MNERCKKAHEHDWEACPGSYEWITGLMKRKKVRCPECGRRLLPTEEEDENGFVAYAFPRHKPKKKKGQK